MGESDSTLIQLARLWVIEQYPYNRTHLLKSLDWLDRIAPGSSEAARLATLTHDMERAFGGPDAIPIRMNDRAYEKAHSDRSARIVGEWLRANGSPADLVKHVEDLIRVHEWGGWPEANLVQAADSLSFLETNIELMLGFVKSGRYTLEAVSHKIDEMYHRIQLPAAAELARPMWERARARLAQEKGSGGFLRPESLDELFSMLREHPTARILAGGTDLLVRWRKEFEAPAWIVDLKRVREIPDEVVRVDEVLRIGARTVITDVIANTGVRAQFPALVEAALAVGSVQIRNRATIAGNICNASPAADTSPPLVAYGAIVNVASATATRSLPLEQFFAGPGRTTLAPGEIVHSVDLPLPTQPTGSAFGRLTRRRGVDLALVNLCCVVRESGDVRFGFGAVGPRAFAVEMRLGESLDRLFRDARPISDLRATAEYRRAMLPVLARRALNTALERMNQARRSA
jgi:carbon-monoxide dehydrogenase medium subunit